MNKACRERPDFCGFPLARFDLNQSCYFLNHFISNRLRWPSQLIKFISNWRGVWNTFSNFILLGTISPMALLINQFQLIDIAVVALTIGVLTSRSKISKAVASPPDCVLRFSLSVSKNSQSNTVCVYEMIQSVKLFPYFVCHIYSVIEIRINTL